VSKLCILKNKLGLKKNLIIDSSGEQVLLTDSTPSDCLIYGGNEYVYPGRCLEELLTLCGDEIQTFPKRKYINEFISTGYKGSIEEVPWRFVFPKHEYDSYVKELINECKTKYSQVEKQIEFDYYKNIFAKTSEIFKYIQVAHINKEKYEECLLLSHNNDKVLKFRPSNCGFADLPIYSKVKSRTGRTTITSGPNILLLDKKYRKILDSRFGKDGTVIQLDYKSLEPRVMLALSTKYAFAQVEDIYKDVIREFELNISRDTIKTAVLAKLFGAGEEKLRGILTGARANPIDIINAVEQYFPFTEMKDVLNSSASQNNNKFIRNYYGRKINIEDSQEYVLLNYYIQSTSVDIALMGFVRIMNEVSRCNLLEKIIPIFINHDALFVDCHNDFLEELREIKNCGEINTFSLENIKFYIKMAELV